MTGDLKPSSIVIGGVGALVALAFLVWSYGAYQDYENEKSLIRMADWTAACPEAAHEHIAPGEVGLLLANTISETVPSQDVSQAQAYLVGKGPMPDLPCQKRIRIRDMLHGSL